MNREAHLKQSRQVYLRIQLPNKIPNDSNMATEAVPNEIPNDCDMATELVPNEIQYVPGTYWIAYRMASWETVEITTKRWSPRSHSDGYHCERTSHGDREDYREPYRTKPLTKTLTEWHTKGSILSPNGIPKWIPILLIGSLPNDYREANGYSTEAAYQDGHREVKQERTKAIIQMTFTETLLNAEARDGEICKCNVQSSFPRAEAL